MQTNLRALIVALCLTTLITPTAIATVSVTEDGDGFTTTVGIPVEALEEIFGEDYLVTPMHEECYFSRQGENGREYYCCKHDKNGHHVCQWYAPHCGYTKMGDTVYYACAYRATGENKQVHCTW